MLELPELELLRRFISTEAAGRRVETIRVADRYVLNGLSPRTLYARLTGTRLQPAWRRGSVIGIPTDGDWTVLLHLSPGSELVMGTGPGNREDRLELELDGGAVLRFRGGRLKGSIGIARRREGAPDADLGPDALAVSAADFDERARIRRGQLKNSLVDQSFLSGLGDVLADEILFRARLHPNREWKALTPEERRSLWMAIWKTLRDALQVGADYRRKPHWLAADRRPGRPCPRCGHPISAVKGRRPTVACLRCQPLRGLGQGRTRSFADEGKHPAGQSIPSAAAPRTG